MLGKKVYRARGTAPDTGKEVFITNVWRRTPQEAHEDIAVYGQRFKNTNVAELDWAESINKGKRRNLPRM
jgi:hypothetical protein